MQTFDENDQAVAGRTVRVNRGPVRFAWRVFKVSLGFLLLLVGAVLAVPGVPGPGFLIALAGLVLLSAEFIWARRWRRKVEGQVDRVLPRRWRFSSRRPPPPNAP